MSKLKKPIKDCRVVFDKYASYFNQRNQMQLNPEKSFFKPDIHVSVIRIDDH